MPYVENATDDPVIYTDTGPGGGIAAGGCNTSRLRPKDSSGWKPLYKGDRVKDDTVQVGWRVCFHNPETVELLETSGPIKQESSVVKLIKVEGGYEVTMT